MQWLRIKDELAASLATHERCCDWTPLGKILLQPSLLKLFLGSCSDSRPQILLDFYPEAKSTSFSQHHGNLLHHGVGKGADKPDENHDLLEPNHRMAIPWPFAHDLCQLETNPGEEIAPGTNTRKWTWVDSIVDFTCHSESQSWLHEVDNERMNITCLS